VGGDGAPDEWTLCQNLGSKCASVFEERYASFINTTTIDELANVGVNTLRIPLTYAAFIEIPGSQLHHGNQLKLLKTITDYATNKYNMHGKSIYFKLTF
jgi:aryl-phospho-beta-D-glucosidase BglC (GH1 family)